MSKTSSVVLSFTNDDSCLRRPIEKVSFDHTATRSRMQMLADENKTLSRLARETHAEIQRLRSMLKTG